VHGGSHNPVLSHSVQIKRVIEGYRGGGLTQNRRQGSHARDGKDAVASLNQGHVKAGTVTSSPGKSKKPPETEAQLDAARHSGNGKANRKPYGGDSNKKGRRNGRSRASKIVIHRSY